jgi:hypothetical protein
MAKPGPKRQEPMERFTKKVSEHESGCWLWTGSGVKGYGQFWDGERLVLAHRFAFEALSGPIPDGMVLDHLCRTKACVNPAHLEPVKQSRNIGRGVNKGARAIRTDACWRGHALSGENVYINPSGYRQCRECQRRRSREYKARKRAAIRSAYEEWKK